MNHTFDIVSKKSLSYSRSSRIFSFLSSRSFIVLHFTFKSTINFELIFVKCVRFVSRFFFCLACSCPVFPVPFVEKTVFSLLYYLWFFVEDQLTVFTRVSFWALYSVPVIYLSILLPITECSLRALADLIISPWSLGYVNEARHWFISNFTQFRLHTLLSLQQRFQGWKWPIFHNLSGTTVLES